jgi:TPR repeat protein
MARIIFLLLLFANVCEAVAAATIDDGIKLFNQKKWSQAREIFLQGEALGSGDAKTMLGVMSLMGLGVPEDGQKALRYFQEGAAKNSPNALAYLATMYLNGIGIQKDESRGLGYLLLASEKGSPDAQILLAKAYYKGSLGLHQDFTKAAQLTRIAANQGIAVAIDHLAYIHYRGEGVTRSIPVAHALYTLATSKETFGDDYAEFKRRSSQRMIRDLEKLMKATDLIESLALQDMLTAPIKLTEAIDSHFKIYASKYSDSTR